VSALLEAYRRLLPTDGLQDDVRIRFNEDARHYHSHRQAVVPAAPACHGEQYLRAPP
jgi:hypothetical protein